jgi:fructose-1,6-bisphosphatase/sedoheptulose 1,7-bisphosphatase-like protein
MQQLQAGIYRYRRAKDHGPHEDPYPYEDIQGALTHQEFVADGHRWRITKVLVHEVAPPLYDHGDVEFNPYLLIPPIAGGVGAFSYMGRGKEFKVPADGAATQASRRAHRHLHVDNTEVGGEGQGKDQNKQDAAFFRGEPLGLGHGTKCGTYNDPLEVTSGAKKLDPEGGDMGVGEGWAPELVDPANWFIGYSGSMSLQLTVSARDKMPVFLSDEVYMDKHQVPYYVSKRGFNFSHTSQQMVDTVASRGDVEPKGIRTATLARARHVPMLNGFIAAEMKPWNIFTPSDGDATLAPAIAAGAIHFARSDGGMIEGIIAAALGIPMGIRTFLQPTSHASLKGKETDILSEEQRFNWSEKEYDELYDTKFYDSEHIGHALRPARENGTLMGAVKSSIFLAETDGKLSESKAAEFRPTLRAILENAPDVRFSPEQRQFLKKVFKGQGFIDVRRTLTFSDLVPTRDWQYAGTAITPNRWAPLEGIRTRDHRIVVDTLVVGGSNVVYVLETEIQDLGPFRK